MPEEGGGRIVKHILPKTRIGLGLGGMGSTLVWNPSFLVWVGESA